MRVMAIGEVSGFVRRLKLSQRMPAEIGSRLWKGTEAQ
jgi:hypothetical protein